jgi:hypothetical protein
LSRYQSVRVGTHNDKPVYAGACSGDRRLAVRVGTRDNKPVYATGGCSPDDPTGRVLATRVGVRDGKPVYASPCCEPTYYYSGSGYSGSGYSGSGSGSGGGTGPVARIDVCTPLCPLGVPEYLTFINLIDLTLSPNCGGDDLVGASGRVRWSPGNAAWLAWRPGESGSDPQGYNNTLVLTRPGSVATVLLTTFRITCVAGKLRWEAFWNLGCDGLSGSLYSCGTPQNLSCDPFYLEFVNGNNASGATCAFPFAVSE